MESVRYSIFVIGWILLLAVGCQPTTSDNSENPPEMEKEMEQEPEKDGPLMDALQLVVVTANDETTIEGTLSWYERDDRKSPWRLIGKPHPIALGKNGLAWGRGEIGTNLMGGEPKKEGDGKAPAGIYSFGSAFGDASLSEMSDLKWEYKPVSDALKCVDDVKSVHYNQMVDETQVKKDWNSAEDMRQKDGLYKWGLVVNHNTDYAPGNGSCIFFHIWRGEGRPTAGCTAMTEDNMLALIKWLDPDKAPRLVQMTEGLYRAMIHKADLPPLGE